MAVTTTLENIKFQLSLLEPEFIKGISDELIGEYIKFATLVVNSDVLVVANQNEAVLYLTLHYMITNKGSIQTSITGGGSGPQGTFISEKSVGDVSIKYNAYTGEAAKTAITTLGKTKYYEMYLLLKGEELDKGKGGTTKPEKKREPLEYQSW